jgi:SNF2 family DNA or RNA helicase
MVQMTPAQRRFYSQMEQTYVAWLTTPDENGQTPVVAELPIVARSMLRFCALGLPSVRQVARATKNDDGSVTVEERDQLYFEDDCESPKITELLSVLDEMGDGRALILTHSQRFAKVVVDKLRSHGVDSFEWSGAAPQRQRDAALTEFIAGRLRTIVAVITAIGTGTDGLQEATNTEIWLSEEDDPTANQQARGRLDRRGQQNQVVRIYIRATGTQDEDVYSKNLQQALRMASTLRKRVQ